jgi:hypothetical protein
LGIRGDLISGELTAFGRKNIKRVSPIKLVTDLDKVDNISRKSPNSLWSALAEIDVMQADRSVSRDGASTPYYRTALADLPVMVVFPLAVFGGGIPAEEAQRIYQIAFERARAACRPSIWDLAQRPCMN